jgi:hypothetical protein
MPRLIILLAACAAAACSASTKAHTNDRATRQPSEIDTLPVRDAVVDLTGAWASGSTNEPNVPRIVIRPECNYSPALWVLQQNSDTVRAWDIPESRAQGIRVERPVSTVAAVGRISGADVTMRLGDSRYLLRYDSTSGHLRGTLNGAPFWAIRQEIVRPQGCIPVP